MLETGPSRQELVRDFINEHVLNHAGGGQAWNVPFLHIPGLDWLRYDWVMLGVTVLGLVLLGSFAARRHNPVPTGISNAFEAYVVFIRDSIAVAQLGPAEGPHFTSYFCTLFLFILSLNLLGLIPLCATATGNLSVTCAMGLLFLALAVGMAIRRRGLVGFLKTFVPTGAPWPLLPLLVPIEFVSLLVRTVALMVRLFANMMAGHITIFAIMGLAVIFSLWSLVLILPMLVLLFFFEIFVAVLQAYIFTLLSAVFMGLLLNPEH